MIGYVKITMTGFVIGNLWLKSLAGNPIINGKRVKRMSRLIRVGMIVGLLTATLFSCSTEPTLVASLGLYAIYISPLSGNTAVELTCGFYSDKTGFSNQGNDYHLDNSVGYATTHEGYLYVADRGMSPGVYKYDKDFNETFLFYVPTQAGHFEQCFGITTDGDHFYFVVYGQSSGSSLVETDINGNLIERNPLKYLPNLSRPYGCYRVDGGKILVPAIDSYPYSGYYLCVFNTNGQLMEKYDLDYLSKTVTYAEGYVFSTSGTDIVVYKPDGTFVAKTGTSLNTDSIRGLALR